MADNVILNVGAGGATLATDDVGGIQHQRVKIEIGVDGAAADVNSGNPLPVTGTVAVSGAVTTTPPANASTNVAQVAGTAVSVSSGNKDAGTLRVTLATDQVALTNALKVDGSAVTQPVSGTVTANLEPLATGGVTMSKAVSAATTNATSLKASAGKVYGLQLFNLNAAPRYFKLYNKASAPTVGTDVPVKTILIPGNTAGAGAVMDFPMGLGFSTGIAWALTTGITDGDSGAVAANEIVVNIDYK